MHDDLGIELANTSMDRLEFIVAGSPPPSPPPPPPSCLWMSYSNLIYCPGAGIAQLVVLGLAVHSVAGSILLWGHFPVEGIFPLELTPSDESINRGLVCAHMHFIARTQKILTFMS